MPERWEAAVVVFIWEFTADSAGVEDGALCRGGWVSARRCVWGKGVLSLDWDDNALKHFATVLIYSVSINASRNHLSRGYQLKNGNKNHAFGRSFRPWSKVLVGPSQRWCVVPQVLLLKCKVQIWPRCRGSREKSCKILEHLHILDSIWSEYVWPEA